MKIKYKDAYIYDGEDTVKTLLTSGKYLEGNVEIEASGGGETVTVEPLDIVADGVYKAPENYAYDPVSVYTPIIKFGRHCDDKGIWHKPNDWDDIESITIDDDDSELYYLIDPHAYEDAFFRLRIYGTSCKWSVGRVNNGVFTTITGGEEKTIASGGYAEWTDLDDLEEDYIVVKVTGNPITYVTINAKSTDPKIPAGYTPILMRYGNLPNATSAGSIANYYIESDNVKNWFANKSNVSFSLGSLYSTCYNLCRLRIGSWNIANQRVTSLASMFASCVMLSDIDSLDFTGWCSSYTTTVSSFLSTCNNLTGRINVSNWDVSNVTTFSTVFGSMYNIDYIDGLNTWNAAGKVTTCASMFTTCYKLKTIVDISSWNLGNGTANLTTCGSMFASCYSIPKIIFKNINLSKCVTVSSVFSYCYNLSELVFDNVTPVTSVCTTVNGMFSRCRTLTELPNFNGWDFTNANVLSFCSCCDNLKRIDFTGATPSTFSVSDGSGSPPHASCWNVEYVDLTCLFTSFRNFTSTYMHSGISIDATHRHLRTLILPGHQYKAITCTSYSLSHDSLVDLLNGLDTVTGSIKLTMGSINLAKLTNEEKAIATGKGWTLA